MMTGDNSATPRLELVSRTVILHAGDQVTSSGDGGLLPAGLPVGTVVADGAGGWRVVLLADAAASQDVEILNFSKPPETPPASAQLPAEAAGLKPQVPAPPAAQVAAAQNSSQANPQTNSQAKPQADAPPKPKPVAPPADAAGAEDVDR
jgi:rod shape-determining protein MreC